MSAQSFSLTSQGPDDTAARARQLARQLAPGDVVLLSGDVGAGQTHFARSLILAPPDTPEDIPPPTFSRVQTYDDGSRPPDQVVPSML